MIKNKIKSKLIVSTILVLISTFSIPNLKVNASEAGTPAQTSETPTQIANKMEELSNQIGQDIIKKYGSSEVKSNTVYVAIDENLNSSTRSTDNKPRVSYHTREEYLKEFQKEQSAVINRAFNTISKSWIKVDIYASKKDTYKQYVDGVYTWLTWPKVLVGNDVVALSCGEGANMLTQNVFLENCAEYADGEFVKSQGVYDVKLFGNALAFDFYLGSNSKLVKPQYGVLHAEGSRIGTGVQRTTFNFSYFHKQVAVPSFSLTPGSKAFLSISPAYAYDRADVQVEVAF